MPVTTWSGTPVVPGIAHAPAVWARPRPALPPGDAPAIAEAAREAEVVRYSTAAATVADRLETRAGQATGAASEVLAATAGLARDRGWTRATTKLIKAGTPAEQAVLASTEQFVATFESLGGIMAERTTDLKDIRDRIIAELTGQPEPGVPAPDQPVVLLAEDLAPADTAGLDATLVRALVTRFGGPTSHTAIIARQLGIPCIVGVTALGEITAGTPLLVDGTAGTLRAEVDAAEAEALVRSDAEHRAALTAWRGPARLADGEHVELLANVQDGAGARTAAASQAEGVGLFRTELCFLSAESEPTVERQAGIYREVLDAFAEQKVVVRTLDAGSDKPLKFATLPGEENPALGVRGIRIARSDEGLLTRQLDAIAAAAQGRSRERTWVMAPMVATLAEAEAFAELCHERDLVAGVMVEVPAAAILADRFLTAVDFLSIGTNDLSQYTMAADRMSPHLAQWTNPWQPAVLTLIQMAARAGRAAGKPVGVCGEAAADPLLACVLVGLGVTSLSMASAAVPGVGLRLGTVTRTQCEAAAQAAVSAHDEADARARALELLG